MYERRHGFTLNYEKDKTKSLSIMFFETEMKTNLKKEIEYLAIIS